MRRLALGAETGDFAAVGEERTNVRTLWWTIAAHPDVRRLGERCRVGSSDGSIGRARGEFVAASGERFPLADASISRDASLQVREDGDRVFLVPSGLAEFRIAGATASGNVLTLDELDRGVFIQLTARIALILHRGRADASTRPRADDGIVGDSDSMLRVREHIEACAPHSFGVLVRGESGTGKELVSRAIHASSPRSEGPFSALNVAAIADSLVSAELFGHTKGAFSGADRARNGLFRGADGGTVLLDEIGDASDTAQLALLRVLETRLVTPVGADRSLPVDVRVVSATDADLDSRVHSGEFRGSLLQRLSQYVIEIPRLADRRTDIPALVRFALVGRADELDIRERLAPSSIYDPGWLSPAEMERLWESPWSGNVRQLVHSVVQGAVSSRARPSLHIARVATADVPSVPDSSETAPMPKPRVTRPLESLSLQEVNAALEATGFRAARAAKSLGISRSSLYNFIAETPEIPTSKDYEAPKLQEALDAAGGDTKEAAKALRISHRALKLRMSEVGLT